MLLKISVHRHYPAIHTRHFLVCAYHLANPKGKVRLVIFPYFFSHFMNEPVKITFFCDAYNAGHDLGIFCVLDANWEYLLGSFFHVSCIDLLISNVTRFKISLSQSTYNGWKNRIQRSCTISYFRYFMMTSSNGNIFRATGPLCGEFTGHRWILITQELRYFLLSAPE